MTYRPDDFGLEARAWRARREAEARAQLDRGRAEREKEDALRRQHAAQRREEQRRAEFERRVDEAVAALDVLTRDVVDTRRGGLIMKETSGRSGGA